MMYVTYTSHAGRQLDAPVFQPVGTGIALRVYQLLAYGF